MSGATTSLISRHKQAIQAGDKDLLFFGDENLRDELLWWLKKKKLGNSNDGRIAFLWAIQDSILSNPLVQDSEKLFVEQALSEARDRCDQTG